MKSTNLLTAQTRRMVNLLLLSGAIGISSLMTAPAASAQQGADADKVPQTNQPSKSNKPPRDPDQGRPPQGQKPPRGDKPPHKPPQKPPQNPPQKPPQKPPHHPRPPRPGGHNPPGRPPVGHGPGRPVRPRPPHWVRPNRTPRHYGWHPLYWQREYLLGAIWLRDGRTYHWNPSAFRYPLPSRVVGLVYHAERTSNDLREEFMAQVEHDKLRQYEGCDEAVDRILSLDESLETLRARTGSVGTSSMRAMVEATVTRALMVLETFEEYRYLEDLVPESWSNLRSDIRALGIHYGLSTASL